MNFDLTAIGQVLTTVGTLLFGLFVALREGAKRLEARHVQTEEAVKEEVQHAVAELKQSIGREAQRVDSLSLKVDGQGNDIGFLKQRTAGLESAVFHRPPILEDDM